jgi:hypothetical protein
MPPLSLHVFTSAGNSCQNPRFEKIHVQMGVLKKNKEKEGNSNEGKCQSLTTGARMSRRRSTLRRWARPSRARCVPGACFARARAQCPHDKRRQWCTANNFSRRCREPVVARYQHWGRLSSDMWRCKAVLDDLDVSALDMFPGNERDRGSVLMAQCTLQFVRACECACSNVRVHACMCVCVCVFVCSAKSAKYAHGTPDSSAVSDSHECANGPTTAIHSSFVAQRYALFACTSLALVSDVCTHICARVFAYFCTSY